MPLTRCAVRHVRPPWGAGFLSGLLVGEGIYGLTVVGATTSPVCWWLVIAVGCAIGVGALALLRGVRNRFLTIGVGVAAAALFPLALLVLGRLAGAAG